MRRFYTALAVVLVLVSAVNADCYDAGVSYYGRNKYIEYMAGDLPVILSVPHGGYLAPSEIPARTKTKCGNDPDFYGGTGGDYMTQELAKAMRTAFYNATGRYPHVIISHLRRDKLDANRDILPAACGDPEAEIAWTEYHGFIDAAKAAVSARYGTGFLGDVHGHGHTVQRIEIGTLTTAAELRLTDAQLNAGPYEDQNSMRAMSEQSPFTFAEFLRGPTSLGGRLAALGYRSVPSPQDPAPFVGESFHAGLYSQQRHACAVAGTVCTASLEHHRTGLRDSATNRANYARAFVVAIEQFLLDHAGITF